MQAISKSRIRILFLLISFLLVATAHSQDTLEVVEIEYFFDTDPGVGNALNSITVSPDTIVNLFDEVLPTSSLSTGFHTIGMRARNLNKREWYNVGGSIFYPDSLIDIDLLTAGQWGLTETRTLFIDNSFSVDLQLIDTLEYFFDSDPGYGQGIIIDPPAFTTNNTVVLNDFTLTADTLSTGFHVLFMRAKAVGGAWGIPESRVIYIDQSSAAEIQVIDTLEYFFDNDPGYGQGIVINSFTPGTNISLPDEVLTSDTLAFGFHVLYMRGKAAGGAWGMPESRVVFLDQNDAGAVVLVDTLEYFFDIDPGYGLGIPIEVGANNVVSFDSMLTADTLSLGFHILGMRAKAANGPWGTTESRTIYVDPIGVVSVVNVTDLEYFFDTDPGYGNGTSVPITPAGPNPLRQIALAAGGLAEGQHTLHVRARDENGQWGPHESAAFSSYGPGRELDSASLAYVFGQLGGAGWNNATNWLTGPLDTWYGVDVVNTRVDSVQLSGNGLTGELPLEMGYVLNLKKLDLSNNFLQDTIDAELAQLTQLQILDLHNNRIDEMADLSSIPTLNTIHLDTNFFDFGDLEPYVGVPTFTYENQKIVNDVPVDSTAKISVPIVIDKTINGAENNFQWYLNDNLINGADLEDYALPGGFLPVDSGVYVLRVSNNIVTGLELVTESFRLGISDFEEDSLALVSLYNNSNGANWTTNTNWLTGDLSTWNGVTVQNQRVTDLTLPTNNLDGIIPVDFGYADTLVNVDLSNNLLKDTLPDTWEQFYALVSVDLSENDLSSIPNLKLLNPPTYNLNTLNVVGNKLQFGDIETNLGIANFLYAPQDSIGAYRDTLFDAGTPSMLEIPVTGSNNAYQWYRADALPPNAEAALNGENTDTYSLANPVFEDEDWYRLEVTSAIVTDLTLTSAYVNLGISSLKRDSTALLRLYDSTNGEGWITNTNWGTDFVVNWAGVTLNPAQDRVIGLSLPGNNLDGPVPAKLRDITKIETINLSDNEITTIPNMSFMSQLAGLDVSQNRLGFAEIEANLPVSGFNYSNQKNIRIMDSVRRLQFGTDDSLKVIVSGTQNDYQWYFEQFQGAVAGGAIDGAIETNYFLDSINYFNMGTYYMTANSPAVPDLELRTDNFEMIAVTDVFGKILDPFTAPYPDADVILLKIQQNGPYIQLDTTNVDANSDFLFENIDLGDYLLLTRPNFTNNPEYIQTYNGNSIFWVEADTLALQQPIDGDTITIQQLVEPVIGDANISGTVETDFPESGRVDEIEARKKARRAACSVRRFRGAGRGEEDLYELVAYVESNDEGQFEFTDLPEGTYLFNIEYPGIRMNPSSDIEIDVKAGDKIILEALVTEEIINVNDLTLGLPRVVADYKLYPNPVVSGTTKIDYRIARRIEGFDLKVWTLSGQKVFEDKIPHQMGQQSYILDVSKLKKGIYLVHMEDSGSDVMIQTRIIVNNN